jgi:antitoxin (DNA-binding transcriptional repressor) of toxin-antitoxin stability system
MKKAVITVTEAAGNFAGCVNRAHDQDTSFVLLKNGKPVARLVPESERVCTGGTWRRRWTKQTFPPKKRGRGTKTLPSLDAGLQLRGINGNDAGYYDLIFAAAALECGSRPPSTDDTSTWCPDLPLSSRGDPLVGRC